MIGYYKVQIGKECTLNLTKITILQNMPLDMMNKRTTNKMPVHIFFRENATNFSQTHYLRLLARKKLFGVLAYLIN